MSWADRAFEFAAAHPLLACLGALGVFAAASAAAAAIGAGIAESFISLVAFARRRGRHG